MELVIPAPADFSFTETISAHGWRRLLPFVWHEDTQTLSRTEAFAEGNVTALEISADSSGVSVRTDADCNPAELTARVRRMLQLDLPLNDFHAYCCTRPELASLAEQKRGRLLRCPTLWEDTVKAVCKVS